MPWKIDDDFGTTAHALQSGGRRVERATAEKVKADAQAKAPVKSGKLRDSARVVESEEGVIVEFTEEYAPQVEHGHMNADGRFVAGKHFLTNSLNNNQETLEAGGEELLRELGAKV